MRSLLRALLVAILLVLSLLLLGYLPATGLLAQVGRSPVQQQVFLLVLALLFGIVSDVIIFALLPGGFWGARLLHTLAIAVLFLIGYLVYLALGRVGAGGLVGSATGNVLLLVPFAIGLLGFLLISALVGPMPRHIDLPGPLRGYLHADETPLWQVQQTRLKHPITPHTLTATNQRLIVYRPTKLGFASSIEDYNYVDIANVRIETGLFFSTIAMKERFQGDDMVFPNIPKRAGEEFVRIVTDQTQRRQTGAPLSGPRPGPAPQAPQPAAQAGADEQALHILQRRLAAGEITPEQYEQLRRVIDES